MTEEIAQLPKNISRPLTKAAIGLIAFLATFAIWAIYAPLATTITLSGTLRSAQASYEIQHPYGGVVKDVFVDLHQVVDQGQLLLRLDTELEQDTLASHLSIRDRLRSENARITALLEEKLPKEDYLHTSLRARQKQVNLQRQTSLETAEIVNQQIAALVTKIDLAEQQLRQTGNRSERYASLATQGLVKLSEHEQLVEKTLLIKGEIQADRTKILDLKAQALSARQQYEMAQIALTHEVTRQRERNLEQLDQIEGQILDLEHRIASAEVRAPEKAVVSSLPVAAQHMFAARGATLITLAHPLQQAHVQFEVPTKYIDQIAAGMSARLVIPSLPQRQMPKIDLDISAISPRATLDETGAPSTYLGHAAAPKGSLDELAAQEGIGTLTEDMPVNLIVTIRETTFADYLIDPFLSAFAQALQD